MLLQQGVQIRLDGKDLDPTLLSSGLRQKQLIFEQAAKIRAEEESLLLDRQDRVRRARTELILAVGALFVVSIALLVFLRFISERDAERLRSKRARLEEAQRQLQEANELLEQRIQQRTRQIAEANAELQAFAHTVAHDLRAPLRNVEGFASALLEDEADRMSDEGKLFAARISAAVVRMDRLITDLLAYSLFTATGTQEIAVEAMKLGLDDYVIKSPRHYARAPVAARVCLDRAEIRARAIRSETRLSALLETIHLGVFRMSLDGKLEEANAALDDMLGGEPGNDSPVEPSLVRQSEGKPAGAGKDL